MGPKCPECRDGKHVNCDGDVFSPELDDFEMCTCQEGDHPLRPDIYVTD